MKWSLKLKPCPPTTIRHISFWLFWNYKAVWQIKVFLWKLSFLMNKFHGLWNKFWVSQGHFNDHFNDTFVYWNEHWNEHWTEHWNDHWNDHRNERVKKSQKRRFLANRRQYANEIFVDMQIFWKVFQFKGLYIKRGGTQGGGWAWVSFQWSFQ